MSVIIDQLRISDQGKTLYINAHVNQASAFDQVYISKITICTEEQVSEVDPISYTDYIYQKEYPDEDFTREINLVLCPVDMGLNFMKSTFSKNMFFVFIECKGTYDDCHTPCGLDEVTKAVTFDYGVIYNQAMNFTKELADTCNIPQNFINYIMNYDALKLSIETDHYRPAINYWKNIVGEKGIFSNGSKSITSKPCGCHG